MPRALHRHARVRDRDRSDRIAQEDRARLVRLEPGMELPGERVVAGRATEHLAIRPEALAAPAPHEREVRQVALAASRFQVVVRELRFERRTAHRRDVERVQPVRQRTLVQEQCIRRIPRAIGMHRPGRVIEAVDRIAHLRPNLLRVVSGEELALEVQGHLEPELVEVLFGRDDTERQSERLRERDPKRMVETDELGPALDEPSRREVPERVDPTPDAISRLEDADLEPRPDEPVRAGQTGEPGAHDGDSPA